MINSFRSISSNFCYAEASTAVFTLNAQLSKDSARTLRRWSIEGSSSSVYRYLKQCLLGWHSHKYLALCIHTILLGLHGQVMAERKHVVLHSSHIRSSSGSSSKASSSASTVPLSSNCNYCAFYCILPLKNKNKKKTPHPSIGALPHPYF